MSPETLPADALAQYRTLQHAVRAAVDRCANGLGQQVVPCPSTPDDPETTLVHVLRTMLRGGDYPAIAQRMLMVLAEAGRQGDAVALFTIERMATFYATQQVVAMIEAGQLGTWPQGLGHAA